MRAKYEVETSLLMSGGESFTGWLVGREGEQVKGRKPLCSPTLAPFHPAVLPCLRTTLDMCGHIHRQKFENN